MSRPPLASTRFGERVDLGLLKAAVAGHDEHNLLAREVSLLHVSPERCRRAEHPGRRHEKNAAHRIEVDCRTVRYFRKRLRLRVRDGLTLTRQAPGVVRVNPGDRRVERTRDLTGDRFRVAGTRVDDRDSRFASLVGTKSAIGT